MKCKLFNKASHSLSTLAKILYCEPPESVVESMGSVIEIIKSIRGRSKSSTRKKDISDISEERCQTSISKAKHGISRPQIHGIK